MSAREGRGTRLGLLALALLAASAQRAPAEIVTLRNGDRVRGKLVARGTVRLRLQTAYGLLVIPLDQIAKIARDDGSEEVLREVAEAGPATAPTPAPTPPPTPVKLGLIVTGKTFWQAWDPRASVPPDPSLRLEVRLDEKPVASYVDTAVDEGEIEGAVVNAFSFAPDAVTAVAGPDARVLLPDTRPGRILLEIELPADRAGERKLGLAYQSNDGTRGDPAWRELASTSLVVALKPDAPLFIRVEQDPGDMEFRRRQM
jgi:hypothetical protein